MALVLFFTEEAYADGTAAFSALKNQIVSVSMAWQTKIMTAARSLFWLLATIQILVRGIFLALGRSDIQAWYAEVIRTILYIGFFAFVLEQGPDIARLIVGSLSTIGGANTVSPADVFNTGISTASDLWANISFGLNVSLLVATVAACFLIIISFSLISASFIIILVESYVGIFIGMILLGFGGLSFTKDFTLRYLMYALSIGLKLMALAIVSKVGADVIVSVAKEAAVNNDIGTILMAAGISLIVFQMAKEVPSIVSGLLQGVSISSSGGVSAMTGAALGAGSAVVGTAALSSGAIKAASQARDAGSSLTGSVVQGMKSAAGAWGSAAANKMMGTPGSKSASTLGLANAKLNNTKI